MSISDLDIHVFTDDIRLKLDQIISFSEDIDKIVKNLEVMDEMRGLKSYSTKELVEELSTREGVDRKDLDPYEDASWFEEGPAVILTIVD